MCQNVVHLTPRNHRRQRCTYHRLVIRPTPTSVNRRRDYFGNPVTDVAIHEAHRRLRVTAIDKIEVLPAGLPDPVESPAWEIVRDTMPSANSPSDLDAYEFCFDSLFVNRAAELADYARESFLPGRPILDAGRDLNRRIHDDFTYDPQATDIQTPWQQVFQLRRGVCQDLAHVAIGCLRSLGLAARYVSGYLRTIPPEGKPRLVGADASHAWLSLYCGPLDWIDFDPTNNQLPTDEHITVAWGRDYSDVAPIRGMFVGGGQHRITVSVDVLPIAADSE